jgi:hypothetical protein
VSKGLLTGTALHDVRSRIPASAGDESLQPERIGCRWRGGVLARHQGTGARGCRQARCVDPTAIRITVKPRVLFDRVSVISYTNNMRMVSGAHRS